MRNSDTLSQLESTCQQSPTLERMSGLRERRHAETKAAIVDAAFTLFEKHGFSNTLMEQIAEHAGVSRSTLYRRYSNKEEIVLEVPQTWLDAWDAAIAEVHPEASLVDATTAGCFAVADTIDASPERVLAAYGALSESATLQLSGAASAFWLERIAALVEARAESVDHFEAMVIAGACMGAIDVMMATWASTGGKTLVRTETHRVIERISPILDV